MIDANSSEAVMIESFRLVPVVEIEPFPYKAEDRTHPEGLDSNNPEYWSAYWRDSLADSGITGLHGIREASWHVSTDSFQDANQDVLNRVLGIVWRHQEQTPETLHDLECSPLSGGLALVDLSNDPLIEPACCSDLRNVSDWSKITKSPPQEWTMLWIGHPWVHVRVSGECMLFSELTESNTPESVEFQVSVESLRHELFKAQSELTRFASLVEKALISYGCSRNPRAVARHLSGLTNCDPSP